MIVGDLHFEELDNGRVRLIEPLVLMGETIPEGFETDFYSVRCFGKLVVPTSRKTAADRLKLIPSIDHDYSFVRQHISRSQADARFLALMSHVGMPVWQRHLIWSAVRIGGLPAWNKNARQLERDPITFLRSYGLDSAEWGDINEV